ncbi:MAG: PhoH family protein, partial [Myxococcaceae bacterium]
MRPTSTSPAAVPLANARVELGENDLARAVAGAQNENLKLVERRLGLRIGQRGAELLLSGPAEAVAFGARLFDELAKLVRAGRNVFREDVEQAIKVMGHEGDV